ncbi:MAG: hypothetical protein Q8N26_10165 [Myxococcales bacterium]|nr:hypothetical protein [Myxococcales bacterium]
MVRARLDGTCVETEDAFGDDENDLPLEQLSEGIDRNMRAFDEKHP